MQSEHIKSAKQEATVQAILQKKFKIKFALKIYPFSSAQSGRHIDQFRVKFGIHWELVEQQGAGALDAVAEEEMEPEKYPLKNFQKL